MSATISVNCSLLGLHLIHQLLDRELHRFPLTLNKERINTIRPWGFQQTYSENRLFEFFHVEGFGTLLEFFYLNTRKVIHRVESKDLISSSLDHSSGMVESGIPIHWQRDFCLQTKEGCDLISYMGGVSPKLQETDGTTLC
ncbi:uncharacterized protein G2W53_008258 [Senna tora]|uniref:Uncharacterized protein n=1 Tax=Senna tora TaxID=362788 RepID=A0A835CFN1_9FABA|nr:uncharacterized protein G2W53_008258 [Senna tora]